MVKADVLTTRAKLRPTGWLGEQIDSLPAVAAAAKSGTLKLHVAAEIDTELLGAPPEAVRRGKFSMFHGVPFERAPDPFYYGRIVLGAFDGPTGVAQRLKQNRNRLST